MFQKMKNRKGFTLIEMLVVIAIIAVLVSIIIPVVGNSTTKAKAAANAANLRSLKAEITVEMLAQGTNESNFATFITGTDWDEGISWKTVTTSVAGYDATKDFSATYRADKNDVYVTVYGLDINAWAGIAGTGE